MLPGANLIGTNTSRTSGENQRAVHLLGEVLEQRGDVFLMFVQAGQREP